MLLDPHMIKCDPTIDGERDERQREQRRQPLGSPQARQTQEDRDGEGNALIEAQHAGLKVKAELSGVGRAKRSDANQDQKCRVEAFVAHERHALLHLKEKLDRDKPAEQHHKTAGYQDAEVFFNKIADRIAEVPQQPGFQEKADAA